MPNANVTKFTFYNFFIIIMSFSKSTRASEQGNTVVGFLHKFIQQFSLINIVAVSLTQSDKILAANCNLNLSFYTPPSYRTYTNFFIYDFLYYFYYTE